MARRATEMHPHWLAKDIHRGWKESGLPLSEIRFRYRTEAIARGFPDIKGDAAVKRWCYGWSIPQAHQLEVLAAILNPVLLELGKEPISDLDKEGPPTDSGRIRRFVRNGQTPQLDHAVQAA